MANAAEALGQDMQEKAAHELVGVQRHRLGLVFGAIILPPKADAAILAIEKTAVGDVSAPRNRVVLLQFADMDAVKAFYAKLHPLEADVGSKYASFREVAIEGIEQK